MSFQDEYKITSADRLDKGVYGLPDTPGMTTAAIQERFDSLGNLAIDKFNALVEAASDVVDGSDTKFPTNKAVQDYISGEGGAIIDDTTPSLHKAYSSQKVENMFGDVASRVIDDTEPLSNKTYSSEEIEEKLSNIPSPESIIDDDTASTDTTYSSSKLESDFISVSDTEEQTATDEFTTINGGLLSSCKVALSPNQDLHGYAEPWVGGAGKNKLPLVLADIKSANTSGTWSGNIYSVSGGTIEVLVDDANNVIGIKPNGTFSATVIFYLVNNYTFKAGSYALNGCPTGGDSSTYELRIGNIIAQDYGSGATYTLGSDTMSMASIIIRSGQDMSGKNFYPMIRLATESDPTFEPYSNICPISGHTQVEVGDDGKNRFNPSTCVLNKYIDDDGTIGNANGFMYSQPICVKDGSYKFSGSYSGSGSYSVRILGYDKDDNFVSLLGRQGGSASQRVINVDATVTSGIKFVRLSLPQAINEPQLELGSTATAYEPYNGYQVTVNLGGTYYSGVLDVVSGVFTPDTASVVFDGSENWTIYPSDTSAFFFVTVSTMTSISWSYVQSEVFKDVYRETDARNNDCSIWSRYQQIHIHAPSSIVPSGISNEGLAEFKAWLSNNPQKVVYKLATPQSIQLSPTMVKALVGENHLSAPLDGQEITESIYSPLAKWNAVIDDTTASDDTTYSSNKINTIVPKIDDNTTSASKVFSSLKTANLITELSERFDFSTTEKPLGWWTDGKVYYGKVINIMGCPKEMFGLMVDLGVEVDTFIGIFAVGNAKDDNYNGGYCMGGTIYCKVIKSEGQNTQIQPACAVMALGGASLLVLYTKAEE